MNKRDEDIYIADLAERSERYQDMADAMKSIVKKGQELSTDERNNFSTAYKKIISDKRFAWRIVTAIELKEQNMQDVAKILKIKEYKEKIKNEIICICEDLITMLDKDLITFAKTSESKVFYYKMKGDYLRYIAEISTDELKKEVSNKALFAYNTAKEIAYRDLTNTNPVRLGLILNFSVFYYDILNDCNNAYTLSKQCFDDAITNLDKLSDDSFRETSIILQYIKENILFWISNANNKK